MEIEKLKDMLRNAAGGPVGIQMCQEAADALEHLQSENDRLKQERDAAVAGLHGRCDACQHNTPEHWNDICRSCIYEYPFFHRDGVVIEDRWQGAGIKEVKKNS